jgi:hypothetical protein
MHALLLAAAVGAARAPARCVPARAARIHLVDGMPFVVARIKTLRGRARQPEHAFVLYDGTRELAQLRFNSDGSVLVVGYVDWDGKGAVGTYVDVLVPRARCPVDKVGITLKPN